MTAIRAKALTAKELALLVEIDGRPGASEQILTEALEMPHLELTFYLSTLIYQRLIEYDEIGRYAARLYRTTTAGRRRVVNGRQLSFDPEPASRYRGATAARGTRRLMHDVSDPRSNF